MISHEIPFISVLAPLLKGIHLFDWEKKGNLLWWFFLLSFAVLQYFTSDSIKNHFNSVLLFILRNSKSDGSPKIQRKYREITYLTCFRTHIVSEEGVCTNYFPETLFRSLLFRKMKKFIHLHGWSYFWHCFRFWP